MTRKRPRERAWGGAYGQRDGEEDAAAASEDEDWQRGYQGPAPGPSRPAKGQGRAAAPRYGGHHQGPAARGGYEAHERPRPSQHQGRWADDDRGDGDFGGGKRQRQSGPERRQRWDVEEIPAEEDQEELEWEEAEEEDFGEEDFGHHDDEPEDSYLQPAPKRMLPRPKPKPKPKAKGANKPLPLKPPPMPEDDLGNADEDDADMQLIAPMLAMTQEIIEVPKKFIAKIIGKKGDQIKMIRKETGAHVDARDQTQDPCQVKLLGTPDAIEVARHKIFEIIEQAKKKPGHVLEVPRAKIGKVIGPRGATIHEIQTSTGAKVDIDKDVDPCQVVIGGSEVQIAEAEKLILQLAMEAADIESEYLELPSLVSGAVLGVRGARLHELMAQSGARIDVDKTRPATCLVRIAGPPAQRALAKQLVLAAAEAPKTPEALQAAAAAQNEPTALEARGGSISVAVVLPRGGSSRLLCNGGAAVQSAQRETGARIWVDPVANQVRLQGHPATVDRARLAVQALFDEELPAAIPTPQPGGGIIATLNAQAAAAQATFNANVALLAQEQGAGAGAGADAEGAFAAEENPWLTGLAELQVSGDAELQEQEEEAWEWTGQEPVVDSGEAVADEAIQEPPPPPPPPKPQTPMQRAFAAMAARRAAGCGGTWV